MTPANQNKETEVTVDPPIETAKPWIDVETGEVAVRKGNEQRLTVTLSDRRSRLFYSGPGWKQ